MNLRVIYNNVCGSIPSLLGWLTARKAGLSKWLNFQRGHTRPRLDRSAPFFSRRPLSANLLTVPSRSVARGWRKYGTHEAKLLTSVTTHTRTHPAPKAKKIATAALLHAHRAAVVA